MKKFLSLIYGWIGGALGGGTFLTALFWIHDALSGESSTFYLPHVLYRTLLMSVWVGVVMTPGVVIAAVIRFYMPTFRDFRSLIVACAIALLSVSGGYIFLDGMNRIDLPVAAAFACAALLVAILFWWIALKTDRVEHVGDGKPDPVSS
jgi:hypothetical protein